MGWIARVSLADLQTICQIAAILVGGVWVYFNFLRGRTFRPRLEFTLSVASVRRTTHYVTIKYSTKNVGLSRVRINRVGSILRVLAADPVQPRIMISPDWRHLGSYAIFEDQGWIEPAETVSEERLLVLPDDGAIAIKLELSLASRKTAWRAVTVSMLPKEEEAPADGTTATTTAAENAAARTAASAAGNSTAAASRGA
jgi:hypothetical protein